MTEDREEELEELAPIPDPEPTPADPIYTSTSAIGTLSMLSLVDLL